MTKKITRSTVNEQQYSAPEFPKSGFSLSYRRYTSFGLGKIHVGGFHFTMPGDKISGQTRGKLTFHRIVTPIVSPVNAMQYNVYLPLRPLDRTFKKGVTPTKLNAMSVNWTMPQFNTRHLVDFLLRSYFGGVPGITLPPAELLNFITLLDYYQHNLDDTLQDFVDAGLISGVSTVGQLLYAAGGLVITPVQNLTMDGTTLTNMADQLYMRDSLLEIVELINAKLGTGTSELSGSLPLKEFIYLYLSTLLTPWIGRYSYYGEFKYEYLRPFDFYRIANNFTNLSGNTWADFLAMFSDTPQNEYAIRAMYAVWYELFRNVDLEPVSTTLPDWQEWGSTSIFDEVNGGNLCYLLYRIRSWEKDMFISAQIDDLSRHVYAPIIANPFSGAAYHTNSENNFDTQEAGVPEDIVNGGNLKPAVYTLGYRDQLTDSAISVQCPVPANINDVLSATDKAFVDVYGLDLNTLRQSQMLERYLKRNYLFGDEYQDRMLAHYNSRVSDMRINKPEILSQSMNSYDMKQEVSNVSTDETKVGDRTATATAEVQGEPYTTFCEEFGIVLSLVCVMPRAMYDGTIPQHYLAKQIDLPLPEFAANNEEFGRKTEIAGSGLAPVGNSNADDNRFMFGRYPAYHAWRSRVDEVGGEFLDELQDCTFRRFFGMFSDDTTPKLNYFFIHCRPNLQMFANPLAYDMQAYGDLVHECYVERVLPVPVETI